MFRSIVKAINSSVKHLAPSVFKLGFKGFSFMPGNFLKPTTQKFEHDFKTNTFIRTPIHRIATDTSRVRWHLYKKVKGKKGKVKRKEITDHAFLNAWNNPCDGLTGTKARYLFTAWRLLVGEAFAAIEWGPGGQDGDPTGWWPTPPHYVWSIPTVDMPFFRVVFPCGEQADIAPGDMLYHQMPDPEHPYARGAGAAQAVADQVEQLSWMSKFNSALFRNGAQPGMIVAVDSVNETNRQKVEDIFKMRHGGYENAFKTAVIGGRVSVVQGAAPPRDLDFDKGNKRLRDTVYGNYTVPPEILGIIENSNRASIQAALNFYQRQCLLTELEHDREFYNTYLLPLWGDPSLELDFENPVQESEEFKLDKADKGFVSGALTVNQWLELNGFDPVPGGDIRFVPKNTVPVANSQLLNIEALQALFAATQTAQPRPANEGGSEDNAPLKDGKDPPGGAKPAGDQEPAKSNPESD